MEKVEEKNDYRQKYIGNIYGQLKVIGLSSQKEYVLCECECGEKVERNLHNIIQESKHGSIPYCCKTKHKSIRATKYQVNLNALKEDSPEKYWLLGLIAADGCISDDGNFSLTQSGEKGKRCMEFVCKLLNWTGGLREYQPLKGELVYSIAFSSQELKEILKQYNIVPRKSLIFTVNNNYPQEYFHYFVEGYIQGDGCIREGYMKSSNCHYVALSFVGTLDFIEYCHDNMPFVTKITKIKTAKNAYVLTWTGTKAFMLFKYFLKEEIVYKGRKLDFLKNWLDEHKEEKNFMNKYLKYEAIQNCIKENFSDSRQEIARKMQVDEKWLYALESKGKIFFFFQKPVHYSNFNAPLFLVKAIKKIFLKEFPLENILEYGGYNNILEKMCDKLKLEKLWNGLLVSLFITQKDNLILLKYNDVPVCYEGKEIDQWKKQFWEIYRGFFKECRSCVIDLEKECYALSPQTKFFNIGQFDKEEITNIRNVLPYKEKIEISNKLDGSNQNYRYYNGEIIGSGSQALDENCSWRLKKGFSLLTENHKKLLKDYPNWTLMFEFISPDNPIVVKYSKEQEGLYLFGMRNSETGEEKTFEEVNSLAQKYFVPCAEYYETETIDGIISKQDKFKADEKEGWVISLWDKAGNVQKYKLKTDDYVLIHKAISASVSPNAVIEAIQANRYDDFISKVPTAYREIIEHYKNTIVEYLKKYHFAVNYYFNKGKAEKEDFLTNRKDAMLWIEKEVPKFLKARVINVYLGKENDFLARKGFCYHYSDIEKLVKQLDFTIEKLVK